MSGLVSRILLAMLMIPAGSIVYFLAVIYADRAFGYPQRQMIFISAGLTTWIFVAIYWTLLWGRLIQWNSLRVILSIVAAGAAVVAGFVAAVFVDAVQQPIGDLVGSVVAPLSWLIATSVLWRETPAERAARLRLVQKSAVLCPKCGYNLTGLQGTRCPEC